MLVAQAWGLVRFVLDFVYPLPGCDEIDDRPSIVKDFHAYYHTFSQILLAFIVAAIISLLTPEGATKEQVLTINSYITVSQRCELQLVFRVLCSWEV